jgi:hypothetical protein
MLIIGYGFVALIGLTEDFLEFIAIKRKQKIPAFLPGF